MKPGNLFSSFDRRQAEQRNCFYRGSETSTDYDHRVQDASLRDQRLPYQPRWKQTDRVSGHPFMNDDKMLAFLIINQVK
ncbi:hypothetical protein KTT_22890 [Tengunoibacter tsumagoiensis]|uniref:Uncharacterized protein n=1 Tax=Tengunoibacter tsumagoiensis TaxID=2014871 RepID=A0A401ZZW7_9CHLR|nr:hypothetical protein KTT_22890 [Tengunoibacter tsumagoiensis]